MLIEQFIDGSEISVESGHTNVVAIHDKRLPMNGPSFEERYFTTPSLHPSDIQEKIKIFTKLANKSLGINIGATHTEFRITDDGDIYY